MSNSGMTEFEREEIALEKEKIALEKRRLEFDERRDEASRRRILSTHLPALLAFFTSLASIFLAYQAQRASTRADADRRAVEIQRLKLDAQKQQVELNSQHLQLSLSLEQDKRKWNIDLIEFVAKNRDLVLGADDAAKRRLSKIMLVAYPRELVLPLFEQLEEVAPSPAWSEGAATAQALSSVGPAQGSIATYAKFGRGANGKWSEKIFDVEGAPASEAPKPGQIVRARTDVFQRSGFPTEKLGVGLIYKREVGVFKEGRRARVVSVQIFREKDHWIQMVPIE